MKREEVISDRVKVIIKDGQPPHPHRVHYLVVVDGFTVWHMTSPVKGQGRDLAPLARFIARKEANELG